MLRTVSLRVGPRDGAVEGAGEYRGSSLHEGLQACSNIKTCYARHHDKDFGVRALALPRILGVGGPSRPPHRFAVLFPRKFLKGIPAIIGGRDAPGVRLEQKKNVSSRSTYIIALSSP